MSNYYAVDRNSEYLAHYGVRGMKWGVRRALARGDRAALSRHYRKAALKLGKLSVQANRGMMQKRYSAAKNNMATGAISSAGLSAIGTMAVNPRLDAANKLKIAGLAGLAGAAGGALLNSRGIMSGRYISDKGHAKAVAKRDAFRKEMESTFKNTGVAPSIKEMRRFHNQITAISNQKDPKAYAQKQAAKAHREASSDGGEDLFLRTGKNGTLSATQSHIKDPATRKKAETYAKHYNVAISKGMDRNSASSYANSRLATKSNKRRNNTNVRKELGYALKSAALSTVMGPAANMYVNSKRAANNDWPEKTKKKRTRS